MSFYNAKLFDFNRTGNMIDNNIILDSESSIKFVKNLQKNKAMGENWKLDIFVDECVVSLSVHPISKSFAYQLGKFEFGVFLNKIRYKDTLVSEVNELCLFASFLTEDMAYDAISSIIIFIEYRYNIKLCLDNNFQKTIYK